MDALVGFLMGRVARESITSISIDAQLVGYVEDLRQMKFFMNKHATCRREGENVADKTCNWEGWQLETWESCNGNAGRQSLKLSWKGFSNIDKIVGHARHGNAREKELKEHGAGEVR